jgi:hypothetical protein
LSAPCHGRRRGWRRRWRTHARTRRLCYWVKYCAKE